MAVGETARLIASLELQDKFSRPVSGITASVGRLESSLGRMGRGVGQVGAGLAKLGTIAAVAAGTGLAAVVTTAVSMEEAFTGIKKTVDETAATSFEELRVQLRGISSDTGTAFEELSRIGEIGGALGIDISSLDEFIDVVNRLTVSTDLTAESASTALGQLGTILHLEGEELRTFSDSLVALGNAGASTEPQIVDIAARFAAAGNAAGLSVNEILALASATASMAIEAEAGGTALSRVFNNVSTNIGTSNKKAVAFADSLGLSAAEFKAAWDRDALGTLQDFLEELGKLDQFEQASLLKSVGITNVRDVSTIRLMAQNFGFLGEQLDVATNSQGALNEESDKFFANSATQFRRLRENVRLTADTIGVELLPVVNELITEFVDFLNLPGSQAGLKQFAKDLASGVRGLVKELKDADFSGLIGTLQLIGDAGKKVVDIFLSLPPGIQAAIVTGAAINKLSGGLLGAGAGNIAGGVGGLFFDRFLARGSSPGNPVWVQSLGGIGGGAPGAGGKPGGLKLPPWVPLVGGLGLGTATGITALPVVLTGSEANLGVQIDMLRFGLKQGQTVEQATAGVTLGAINALLADTSLQTGLTKEQLLALDALDGHMGDLVTATESLGKFGDTVTKRVSGSGKGGRVLPDTAMSPGGTAIKLPDTAMSNLATIATATEKLPPILTRQEIASQTLNAKLAATVPKPTQPGQARPDLSKNIVGAIQNSSSVANAWSARQMAAFAQGTAAQRTTAGKVGEVAQRVNEARGASVRGFGDLGNAQRQVAARVAEARNAINATTGAVREGTGVLRSLAGKKGDVIVKLTSNVSVSISDIQRKITSQQIAVGKGPLESF